MILINWVYESFIMHDQASSFAVEELYVHKSC